MYNILDFGADATGTTDSAPALQSAIQAAVAEGGRVHVPKGRYRVESSLAVDERSAPPSGPDGTRLQICGDGSGASELVFAGTGPMLDLMGGNTGNRIESLQAIRDLRLIGSGIGSIGIRADDCAFLAVSDVYLSGFETAIDLTDCLSSQFERVIVRWNGLGIEARRDDGSRPNALSFDHCILGNNIYGGAHFIGASGVTFHGGTIEGNGSHASQAEGFGVKLTESCVQGAVAASFFGTWFELNKGRADVWMIQKQRPAVVGFHGTTMCRVSGSHYVTNHVFVDNGAHEVVVAALGVGTRAFNDYAPSPERPAIAATNPAALRVEAWGTQVAG
jgi:hypothetical protein